MTWDRRRLLVALAVLTSAVVGARWLFAPGPAATSEAEAPATAEVTAPPAPLAAAPRRVGRSTADEASAEASTGPSPADEAAVPPPTGAPPPAEQIPVRLKLFDAASGADVAGHWAADEVRGAADYRARQAALLILLIESSRGLYTLDHLYPGTSEAATVPVRGGRQVQFVISVRDVGEYVLWDADAVSGVLAAGVSEVVVHLPLRRAMALDVTVLDPTGRPAQGATVAAAWVGGGRVGGGPWPVNADGVARVTAIPFLPGEPLIADVEWTPEPGAQDVVPAPEEGPSAEAPVRTRVPAHPSTPWAVTVRLVGPRAFLSDHNESDNDVAASSAPEPSAPPTAPRGAARVRVVGIDGRPVAGATVTVGAVEVPTATDGEVTVEGLLAGDQTVTARADGHFPMSGSVRVVAGRTTDVELREPVGATLDVLVVDATGAARTAARCVVRTGGTIAPFDVVDGVQRLDDFTDARGRRTFARVAPGTVTLTATWGIHRVVVTRDVRDGERAFVRIELP
ncbi:MAG: carboxypeptidase regulatory-like domain-containing protein [Planctomycetia bacterium]|nr:carboxypeptidase regulatory-like domain-containing protein [Planctomycetia bacterium]